MGSPTDGILLVDKDEGETSADVVRKIKSSFKGSKGLKVGHAGTLDPFASGLLIILLGQGTKLSRFIMSGNKVYLATMRLGIETDTLDLTGMVTHSRVVPDFSLEYIRKTAHEFVGNIEQVTPAYSAVKYKGMRSYDLARKGIKVDLKKRRIIVHRLNILSVSLPDVTFEVKCSSGTYIRALACDLGRRLGTGGHLRSLRRLSSGSFDIQDAVCSKNISAVCLGPGLREKIIPLKEALHEMPVIEVDDLLAEKVRHGYQPDMSELHDLMRPACVGDENVKLLKNGELVAIVKMAGREMSGHDKAKIERVFHRI